MVRYFDLTENTFLLNYYGPAIHPYLIRDPVTHKVIPDIIAMQTDLKDILSPVSRTLYKTVQLLEQHFPLQLHQKNLDDPIHIVSILAKIDFDESDLWIVDGLVFA